MSDYIIRATTEGRSTKALWLILVVLGLPVQANADNMQTGLDVRIQCESHKFADHLACVLTVIQTATTLIYSGNREPKSHFGICFPKETSKNLSMDQTAQIVVNYTYKHPAFLNEGSQHLIVAALTETFPCRR